MRGEVHDTDDCIGCGACADACPMGVIEVEDVATVVDADSCVGCEACLGACPVEAITEIAED